MQTVFTNNMVAHVWAAQSQARGQSNNGQFWFEGRTLYSYGRHYVAGFITSVGVYLVNDSGYSITTARHVSLARRAAPGRAYGVDDLTTAESMLRDAEREPTARGRVAKVAKALESGRFDFPGEDAAAAILAGYGATPSEAARRAAAMAKRDATAKRKAKEAEAARELDSDARTAKRWAAYDVAKTRSDAIATLAKYSARDYGRDEVEREARGVFRAGKAAKAKGWTRIAKAARAHYVALRAVIKDSERLAEVGHRQQKARGSIKQLRQLREWLTSPREGSLSAYRERGNWGAERNAFGIAADSAETLARSAYVTAATRGRLEALAHAARGAQSYAQRRESAARMEREREAREAWLVGGPRHAGGRMSDAEGGALLRAVDVTRDWEGTARAAGWQQETPGALWVIRDGRESGFTAETAEEACGVDGLPAPITGGTLQTSWGADVPLPHAIRAFRFLKLCRDTGQSWAANGRTIRVGHFRIDTVDGRGNFVAGCHRINWAECARVAEALGLAQLAADDGALEPSRGAV